MLHDISDIDAGSINPGLLEGVVQQFSRRPDERPALDVFAITRLLANEHDFGVLGAFAEDGLRGAFPNIATTAFLNRFAKLVERSVTLNQFGW